MDFEKQLLKYIKSLSLDLPTFYDINDSGESLALTRLPGGRVIRGYMDGIKDKRLIYEITGKVKDRELAIRELTKLVYALDGLEDLPSKDGSYEFAEIEISNEVHFNEATTEGFFYFKMDFQPLLTIL